MMSVDERLRDAFGSQDGAWDQAAPIVLTRIRARRRRREQVVRRSVAMSLVVVVTAVAAVLATRPAEQKAIDPVSPVVPTAEVSGGLDGRWRTLAVEAEQVRATLREAGLAEHADDALAVLPAPPFRFELTVDGGSVDLDVLAEGRAEQWDLETLVVRDGSLVLRPRGGSGRSVHRWVLTDGALSLSFVRTTETKMVDGVPAEVWQRVLYDTAPFRR